MQLRYLQIEAGSLTSPLTHFNTTIYSLMKDLILKQSFWAKIKHVLEKYKGGTFFHEREKGETRRKRHKEIEREQRDSQGVGRGREKGRERAKHRYI